jgi:cholesterol transport system auxiliary component
MAGGGRAPATYDLIAPRGFAGVRPAPYQLVIQEPVAVQQLDTMRLMVRPKADQVSYYKGVAWSDRLPRLLQTRMIESFQNSGAVRSVSGSVGQVALASELRAFQIDVSTGHAVAEVDMVVRLINTGSGRVIKSKGFSAQVPARTDGPEDAVAALNQAFTEVVQDMITWVAARKRG